MDISGSSLLYGEQDITDIIASDNADPGCVLKLLSDSRGRNGMGQTFCPPGFRVIRTQVVCSGRHNRDDEQLSNPLPLPCQTVKPPLAF
ncbi:hypothetical protein BBB56_20480 [Candidatus Pantoea deserta]|uniref:Uncharacterized protein n=1 Tax=Candidatus Pantoea deserta TaxID=1869313 RepID=A0A3N4P5H3_9GAMM|nr:hypothetical protein BBB56_20480 [Pantoea deserta]